MMLAHPHDGAKLTGVEATAPASIRRARLVRLVEGGAIGIAGWCILFAFHLLPGFLADTPGLALFTVVGAASNATRLRPVLLALLVVGAALTLLVAETPLAGALAARWVRSDELPDAKLGAVIVTSAGVNPNGTMSSEALDHLLNGLELIRAGRSDLLVSTTVEQQFPGGTVTSAADQSRVIDLFAVPVPWLHTSPGESTRDEAIKTARLLLPKGITRVLVVSAPMHTRRACAAFEAAGFSVTCVPARTRAAGGGWSPGPWPEDRLTVFGDWVYEVFATAKYRSRGWLGHRG